MGRGEARRSLPCPPGGPCLLSALLSGRGPLTSRWSPPGRATVPAVGEGSFQTPGSHGLWVLRALLQGHQESHGWLEVIFSAFLHLLKSFCSCSLSRTCWSNTEGDSTLWAVTPGVYLTPLTRCVPAAAVVCRGSRVPQRVHRAPLPPPVVCLWGPCGLFLGSLWCVWGPCWSSSCLPVAACS